MFKWMRNVGANLCVRPVCVQGVARQTPTVGIWRAVSGVFIPFMRVISGIFVLFMMMYAGYGIVAGQEDVNTGRVTVDLLNVRVAPSTQSAVIMQIAYDEVYPVTGRDAEANWWRIRLDSGTVGWVFARYMIVTNPDAVPVINAPIIPAATAVPPPDSLWPINQDVNVRGGPGTQFSILGALTAGTRVQATGRARGGWVRISYQGRDGWIVQGALPDEYADAIQRLPELPNPVYSNAGWRVVSGVDLKAGNGPFYPTVGRLQAGDVVRVIGRDWDTQWIQIEYPEGNAWLPVGAFPPEFDASTLPYIPM